MYNKKQTVLGVLALLLVFGTTLPSEAAEAQKADTKAPITVEADKLSLNDATGDIFAQGKVSLVQNDSQVLTELLEGNTKTTRVWINGQATLLQPGTKLIGTHLEYNYTDHNGSMEKATGKVDKTFVKGDKITVMPKEMEVSEGWITGCPAEKITCYHVEADRIDIWPGEKLIAYNARFYLRNVHIYTLAKYEKDLHPGAENNTDFPHFDYNNSDGFMISQRIKHPFSDNVSAYADLRYYTRQGFKPIFGVLDTEKHYSLKLEQGEYENGDNEWVKKTPELSFASQPYRIGNSSIQATMNAAWGQWKQGSISGSRQEYGVYFSNDPIALSPKWQLNLGTGYSTIHYGYNDSRNNIWRFDTGVNGTISKRLNVWTSYHYSDESGTSVYDYDKIDNTRELDTGLSYKIDDKNNIQVNTIYNLDTKRLEDVDYTLKHNLHCFEADITYRAKRSQLSVTLSTANW